MPNSTFEHLKEDKQNQVFEALLTEYSHHKLSEAKVSRIVKDCGIPRGSFYTYFQNLDDSYRYTLKRVLDVVHFDVFNAIQNETSDTLSAFYDSTEQFLNQVLNSEYVDFYRLYLEFNQYTLGIHLNHFNISKPIYIHGQLIPASSEVEVALDTATLVAHDVIKQVLLGTEKSIALNKLRILFNVIERGLLSKEN